MHWIGWMTFGAIAQASEPQVVIEVELGPVEQAWMLEMRSGGQSVQVPCSDDGASPDRVKNDDRPTCSGVAPAHAMELVLRNGQEEHSATVEWPDTLELLQARWRTDGVVVDSWPLLPAASGAPGPASPEAQIAVADMLEATASNREPVKTPPEPETGDFWWAALVLLGFGWVAWRIAGVGPVPHVERVDFSAPQVQRESAGSAGSVIAEAARQGVVLVALDQSLAVEGGPGPVLRATSLDVADLLDALSGLARRDPLARITLVTRADELTHADGLGVPPVEALERGLLPGVRMVLLEPV